MIEKKALLEDEALIIRNSGEIPEVAYHGSVYYLTMDDEGPGLELGQEDLNVLKEAVVDRYQQIMLRDLLPENRGLGLYRGLARCAVNWQRLCKYCSREKRNIAMIRTGMAAALKLFLCREFSDVQQGRRPSCVNCGADEICQLAEDLGLDAAELPAGWQELCPPRK